VQPDAGTRAQSGPVSDLPLGGVGASGYGQYTGKFGFDTFTHFRGTMDSPTWLDLVLHNRYPPYTVRRFSLALCARVDSRCRRRRG
jgi:hypothetical protein